MERKFPAEAATAFDSSQCIESLTLLRLKYGEYFDDNRELKGDLERLEACLEDADLDDLGIHAELYEEKCREAFESVLTRLEEMARDHQRFYDESPSLAQEGTVSQSVKYFEIAECLKRLLGPMLATHLQERESRIREASL